MRPPPCRRPHLQPSRRQQRSACASSRQPEGCRRGSGDPIDQISCHRARGSGRRRARRRATARTSRGGTRAAASPKAPPRLLRLVRSNRLPRAAAPVADAPAAVPRPHLRPSRHPRPHRLCRQPPARRRRRGSCVSFDQIGFHRARGTRRRCARRRPPPAPAPVTHPRPHAACGSRRQPEGCRRGSRVSSIKSASAAPAPVADGPGRRACTCRGCCPKSCRRGSCDASIKSASAAPEAPVADVSAALSPPAPAAVATITVVRPAAPAARPEARPRRPSRPHPPRPPRRPTRLPTRTCRGRSRR